MLYVVVVVVVGVVVVGRGWCIVEWLAGFVLHGYCVYDWMLLIFLKVG